MYTSWMTRIHKLAISAFVLGHLMGCGAANIGHNESDRQRQIEAAVAPARTSDDETDGPTNPRTSAMRPPGNSADAETQR